MARELEEIHNSLIDSFKAEPELSAANSDSKRALWRLFLYVQAGGILLLEQLIDVFRAETEARIAAAVPGTAAWLKQKCFDFQYSDTNPQILQLQDFAPIYPVVDESLRIVTRCSVTSTSSNVVFIKVAKSDPPEMLSEAELASLQGYIDLIGNVGINYRCFSQPADKIMIDADVFYSGQYSSVIQENTKAAINNYLSTLPFNGEVKISDLERTIRTVEGVSDCVVNNCKVRDNSTAFVDGFFLVQNKTTVNRLFQTIAGYVVAEDTAGQTLDETLNFIPYV